MEPKKGSPMTEESLKLLGAGTPYKSPNPTNKYPYTQDPDNTTWSHVNGPWVQRHPQGQWK